MKRIFLLFILILAGCTNNDDTMTNATTTGALAVPPETRYQITYGENAQNWLLDGFEAPTDAAPGETVILRAEGLIDADLMLYCNGIAMELTHADADYWEYQFTMPKEDVEITYGITDGFLVDPEIGE